MWTGRTTSSHREAGIGSQPLWPRQMSHISCYDESQDQQRDHQWRTHLGGARVVDDDLSLTSRSYSSISAASSSNFSRYTSSTYSEKPQTSASIRKSTHHAIQYPSIKRVSHDRTRDTGGDLGSATLTRREAASVKMDSKSRQHSSISQADSEVSAHSFTSTSTSNTRLTSKFPVPRIGSHQQQSISRWIPQDRSSSKVLLTQPDSAKDRANVAAKIAQQDARDRTARWTRAKWLLLLSVTTLFSYGLAGLLISLLAWFRTWSTADVLIVAENDVLIYITLASSMCLVTALVGLVGTMLNSRPILAIYNLLLWPSLAAMLLIGYTSYRKQALNLDRKLNQAWSQFFDDAARLRLQNCLHCCGYYSPLHQATFSKRCYPRTALPGCKGKLFRFEKEMLHQIAMTTFAIVPVHLFNIFVALLCANHVNRSFGKGLMPRQYRLSIMDVRENAIQALRNLPSMPDEAKMMKRSDSGNSSIISSSLARHITFQNAAAPKLRRAHRASPSMESLASLPRYSGTLKGVGLM